MQKREQGKSGGSGRGSSQPSSNRGRSFGSVSGRRSRCCHPFVAPRAIVSNKRIVLALQSGIKSELTWAFNALALLSFDEKEDTCKDAAPLAKIPCLLDALLQIDDSRDVSVPEELVRATRARTLGSAALVTEFGNEYDVLGSNGTVVNIGQITGSAVSEVQKSGTKSHASRGWLDEGSLSNLDDEGHAEKLQLVIVSSNVIGNFSFMPENGYRHCLKTVRRRS